MVFLYVDARSDDYRRLAAAMDFTYRRFGRRHVNEIRYVAVLAALRDGQPWRDARSDLAWVLDGDRAAVDSLLAV
jgi:hypothetical protein